MRQELITQLSEKISQLMKTTAAAPTPRLQSGYEHTVGPGETLSEIARAYKVKMSAIVEANQLSRPDNLKVGQKLFIPE